MTREEIKSRADFAPETPPPPSSLPPEDRIKREFFLFGLLAMCILSGTYCAVVGVFDRPSGQHIQLLLMAVVTGVFALMQSRHKQ